MKYMIAFMSYDEIPREILCDGYEWGTRYSTRDINEAYRFRNQCWGDINRQYVKQVEDDTKH
jgi:hypothetical protein